MDHKIIYSLSIFKGLPVLTKILHENLKGCQNRVSQLLTSIHNKRIGTKFKGNCSIQNNISSSHKNIRSRDLNTDFTLDDYFFGAMKLTKNADPNKYRHSGYVIQFNVCSQL